MRGPLVLPLSWFLSSFHPRLGCTGHHPGTEDTALAGSQQAASWESSRNLQWALAAGSGKGWAPSALLALEDGRGVGFPDKIWDVQLNLDFGSTTNTF